MGRWGRLRPRSSAPLIICATLAGSRRSSRGEKCNTMMPAAAIRSWRRLVRSQSSGDRCQARESTSPATPASGHHRVGLAQEEVPVVQGRVEQRHRQPRRRTTSRRSPSAVDLMPSATSPRTERNIAEPLTGPVLSSSASWPTVHRPSWTASATTARTSRSSVSCRAVSATARGTRARRTGPIDEVRAGIRAVRCSRAKPVLRRCRSARHQHVDDLHGSSGPDAVVQQGHRAGDEAARPGIRAAAAIPSGTCSGSRSQPGRRRAAAPATDHRAGRGTASRDRSCRARAVARGWPRRTASPGARPGRRGMMFGAWPEHDTGI